MMWFAKALEGRFANVCRMLLLSIERSRHIRKSNVLWVKHKQMTECLRMSNANAQKLRFDIGITTLYHAHWLINVENQHEFKNFVMTPQWVATQCSPNHGKLPVIAMRKQPLLWCRMNRRDSWSDSLTLAPTLDGVSFRSQSRVEWVTSAQRITGAWFWKFSRSCILKKALPAVLTSNFVHLVILRRTLSFLWLVYQIEWIFSREKYHKISSFEY